MARLGQFRRDTYENWMAENPILADGEFFLVAMDSSKPREYTKYGCGNGTSTFNELKTYFFQGGGGSGTTNYKDLENKPSINGVVLDGNKTSEELKLTASISQATETVIGGIKAASKTSNETVEAKIDPNTGKLFVPAGGMTTEQQNKLNSIENGANKTVIEQSVTNSTANVPSSNAVRVEINTAKSELNVDIENNTSNISSLQTKVNALSGIDSPFVGYFDAAGKLPARTSPAWALVGNLVTAKPYAYYVAGNVPNGYSAGWNDLSVTLGTYDFTDLNGLKESCIKTGSYNIAVNTAEYETRFPVNITLNKGENLQVITSSLETDVDVPGGKFAVTINSISGTILKTTYNEGTMIFTADSLTEIGYIAVLKNGGTYARCNLNVYSYYDTPLSIHNKIASVPLDRGYYYNVDVYTTQSSSTTRYACNGKLLKGQTCRICISSLETDADVIGGKFAWQLYNNSKALFTRYNEDIIEYTATEDMDLKEVQIIISNASYVKCKLEIIKVPLSDMLKKEERIKNDFIKDILYRNGKYIPSIVCQKFNGAEYDSSSHTVTIPTGMTGKNTTLESKVENVNNKNITLVSILYSNKDIRDIFDATMIKTVNGINSVIQLSLEKLSDNIFVLSYTLGATNVSFMNLFIQKNNSDVFSENVTVQMINSFYYDNAEKEQLSDEAEKNYILSVVSSKIKTINYTEINLSDYSDLRDCLASITPTYNNRYVINIEEGVYDIKSMYSSSEISAGGFIGLTLPDYIVLRGKGNRDNVVLSYESDEKNINISTLNLKNDVRLENLTVKGVRTRYAVHDDFGVSGIENIRNIINCRFISEDTYYNNTYGSGLVGKGNWNFKDCMFEVVASGTAYPFSNHNNTNVDFNSLIHFDNCRFISNKAGSYLRFGSLTNNSKGITLVKFTGCNFDDNTKVRLMEEAAASYGSGILFKVTGYGNNIGNEGVTITNTDGKDYSSCIDLLKF